MTNAIRVVAANIRRFRAERGISLSELSRRSGVGKATLSGLEASRGNPTIETLWALADALGVAFGELAAESQWRPVEVVRAGEGARVSGSDGEVHLLGNVSASGLLEAYEMSLAAGEVRKAAAHPEGVAECVFVTRGGLLAGPSGEAVELGVGDFLRFPADRPHVYAAVGDGGARAVVLVGYPKKRREEQGAP